MKIVPLSDEYQNCWDSYVHRHNKGTFFHQIGWMRVVESTFGHKPHYYLAVQDSRVIGVLPLFSIKSKLFGKAMVSIPFAAYGDICADTQNVQKALIRKAAELTELNDFDYLEVRSFEPSNEGWPTKTLYVTFSKEISSDSDINMKAIPRKARRMIRQGDKHGLEYLMGHDLIDEFYLPFSISVRDLGTPALPKKYFMNLIKEFGHNCTISVIHKDGKPIAGVFSFYFKDQVLPYYAGSIAEYRKLAPNDFIYWGLMKYAAQRGCKIFDFGRSKLGSGNVDFKRHWGFEATPLYYHYFLNKINEIPEANPLNPKYQRKIAVWKKLPLSIANLIGPHIVKNLP